MATDGPAPRQTLLTGVCFGLALAVAFGLKLHYRTASPEELGWILAPTVRLVAWATGSEFVLTAGEGYLSPELVLLIAPSCAGVNFLIAAFCTGVFGLSGAVRTPMGKALVFTASLAGAYLLTLVANTVRILGGLGLRGVTAPWTWVGREDLHRVEGVVVYFTALCVTYLAVRRFMPERADAVLGG